MVFRQSWGPDSNMTMSHIGLVFHNAITETFLFYQNSMVSDVSFWIRAESLKFAMKRAILMATNVVCSTLRLFFGTSLSLEASNLTVLNLSLRETSREKRFFPYFVNCYLISCYFQKLVLLIKRTIDTTKHYRRQLNKT